MHNKVLAQGEGPSEQQTSAYFSSLIQFPPSHRGPRGDLWLVFDVKGMARAEEDGDEERRGTMQIVPKSRSLVV